MHHDGRSSWLDTGASSFTQLKYCFSIEATQYLSTVFKIIALITEQLDKYLIIYVASIDICDNFANIKMKIKNVYFCLWFTIQAFQK